MRRAYSILSILSVLMLPSLDGCFTDVGNAEGETKVKADFRIDYSRNPVLPKGAEAMTFDTVRIDHFYLSVWEAEIHQVGGGDLHFWQYRDSGVYVDFTGGDRNTALPPVAVPRDSILDFLLESTIPQPAVLDPAALDIATFRKKGYIRGMFAVGRDSVPFLFAMPKTNYLHLRYSREVLETWKRGDVYAINIVFYGLKWISGAGMEYAASTQDSKGRRMILIDPTHNSSLHKTLSTRFFTSFNTLDIEKG